MERFVGDEAIEYAGQSRRSRRRPANGRSWSARGPSGLSAAYHLARLGHGGIDRDGCGPTASGMMRFGIPKYRLPRDVLDAEIQRILDLGVKLELNAKVDSILDAMHDGAYDAAFLAVGTHLGKRAYIPAGSGRPHPRRGGAIRSMEGEAPLLGRRVVVYGGGNTAIDAARTAKRLGAEEAIVVYRRTREQKCRRTTSRSRRPSRAS